MAAETVWRVEAVETGARFVVGESMARAGLEPVAGAPALETAPGTVVQVLGLGGKRHAMVALDAWGRISCCAQAVEPVTEGARVLVQRVPTPVDRFGESGWEYVVVSVAPGAAR